MSTPENYIDGRDIVEGPVTFKFFRCDDENPNLSWLGEHTGSPVEPYYDRLAGVLVVGSTLVTGSAIIEDEVMGYEAYEMSGRGEDAKAVRVSDYDPENGRSTRNEYRYIHGFQNDPAKETTEEARLDAVKACLWDAQRLDCYGNDWFMTGIICKIFDTDGDEDASPLEDHAASLWGIESDIDDGHLTEVCHNLMVEARYGLPKLAETYDKLSKHNSEIAAKLKVYLQTKQPKQ
jgi:hypothetical protein